MNFRIWPKIVVMILAGLFAIAGIASAQTAPDVDNPSAVQFTPSTDHVVIDSYELDLLRPDGSVLQTIDLGKPVPDASNTCTAPINVQPVAFGTGYSARIRARAGSVVSENAVSENKFNRKPGGPSKLIIK